MTHTVKLDAFGPWKYFPPMKIYLYNASYSINFIITSNINIILEIVMYIEYSQGCDYLLPIFITASLV